ncbi:MAG: ComEC/Rec2 family competence protein [Anaerolineaceae bacterium]
MAGILLSAQVNLHWGWWLLIAGSLLIGSWFERKYTASWYLARCWEKISTFPVLFLLACMALGSARYQLSQPVIDPSHAAWYTRYDQVTLKGEVSSFPDIRSNTVLLRVRVKSITLPESKTEEYVNGSVLVRLPWNPDWQVGDQIVLEGKLNEPPGGEGFDYRSYLARRRIYAYMAYPSILEIRPAEKPTLIGLLWKVRNAAEECLFRLLSQDEAALLTGILLGDEQHISSELITAFRNTGTSHIIAISGFNIAILSGLFIKLFNRIFSNKRKSFLFAVTAILLYTLLVGAQPPVVRAAIMGMMGMLGQVLGRRQVGMNSLVFTAAVMTAITPGLLWDASFQLSFCATMGLVLFADPISTWFENLIQKHIPTLQNSIITSAIIEYIFFTLAAQITTLPVMAYHFHQFPLIGLIANPLILPPQPLVMILGGVMVILSLIWFPLGQIFAWIAWPAITYTIKMVSWLSQIGGAPVALQSFSPFSLIVFYLLILLIAFRTRLSEVWQKMVLPSTILLCTALLAISVWEPAIERLDSRLHIFIPEEGNGQGILLQDGHGTTWLIAGGKEASTAIQGITQWQNAPSTKLTGVIWAADHIDRKSISKISSKLPGVILAFDPLISTANGAELVSQSTDWGGVYQSVAFPLTITIGDSIMVHFAASCTHNCPYIIQYKKFTLLMLGKNDPSTIHSWVEENALVPDGILLSEPVSEADKWVNTLMDDALLVINTTIDGKVSSGTHINTQTCGWVDIATDGNQVWVETQR